MRYILLIYQNTEAWNGRSQEDKDVFMHAAVEIRALMHGGGEEG
jgi:hypothetical protein